MTKRNRMALTDARRIEDDAVAWVIGEIRKAENSDWGNMVARGSPAGATAFLQKWLREFAQEGADQMAAVVEMANNGSDLAREVLLKLARDYMNSDPAATPARLNTFYQDATKPSPRSKPKPGPKGGDNSFRSGVLAGLVIAVEMKYAIPRTRSRISSRPSACSVVSKALSAGNFDWPIGEQAVEKIYDLWGPVVRQRLTDFGMFSAT